MNETIFNGQWHEIKGAIKQKWAMLTDDELDSLEGNNEKLYVYLQKRYGYAKEEAIEQVQEFAQSLRKQGNKALAIASQALSRIQKKPLTVMGMTLCIGVILGMLMARR